MLIFISISFVSSVLIAFYHVGIERGFFDESLVCQIKGLKQDVSTSELLKKLESTKVKSCKDISLKIFGLSLATINLFISLLLSIITFINILKNEKN